MRQSNIPSVNEGYTSLLIEEEGYDTLQHSIDSFDNFDSLILLSELWILALLEFCRLGEHLHKDYYFISPTQRSNGNWDKSISLSKTDKLFKDWMINSATSNSTKIIDDLFSYFVDIGRRSASARYSTCFDLVGPGEVEELSWQHDLNGLYMSHMKQSQWTTVNKVCYAWQPMAWVTKPSPSSSTFWNWDQRTLSRFD